jgi:LmbE family N-acetylglucosaminyl deacetylase
MVYIMDSFSASVVPYLATDVEDMLVLDLRSFNGSVTEVIEQFNPDTVIVAYNPSTFSAETSHHGTFNFE